MSLSNWQGKNVMSAHSALCFNTKAVLYTVVSGKPLLQRLCHKYFNLEFNPLFLNVANIFNVES